jgi:glycine/D-amino acid oxidase-like deaminating enzyme
MRSHGHGCNGRAPRAQLQWPRVHIVVIGAGAFGAWTAHQLQTGGANVTLVDAYGPANARASSGDESRIIRCGYGADVMYSRWARRSLLLWREQFQRMGRRHAPLFHPCGVLWLASGEDAYTKITAETLQREAYPITVLDADAVRRRFPHIDAGDVATALIETDCGVLMARRAVQALVAHLEERGVRVLRARVLMDGAELRHPQSQPAGSLTHVTTLDGETLPADTFVFACGAWLPKVFPSLLAGRIWPTRQVVIYFGVPSGDVRFGPQYTPAWVDFAAGIYGVPDLEGRGLKVGLDRHGPLFDPDDGDRVLDEPSIDTAREWLRRRMPALAEAPVVESRVCQYENTATGDFLIDRHPDFDNVWIAGGGSGHGFKHGPAVGEHVAALIQGTITTEPRFSLAGNGTQPQRKVF